MNADPALESSNGNTTDLGPGLEDDALNTFESHRAPTLRLLRGLESKHERPSGADVDVILKHPRYLRDERYSERLYHYILRTFQIEPIGAAQLTTHLFDLHSAITEFTSAFGTSQGFVTSPVEAEIEEGLEECREEDVELSDEVIETARKMIVEAYRACPMDFDVYPLEGEHLAVEARRQGRGSVLMVFEHTGKLACFAHIKGQSTRFRAESVDAEPKALDFWIAALRCLNWDTES